MSFKNKMDMHMHTDNSPDAEHSSTLMCEYAMRNNLRAIAITDHCEINAYYDEQYSKALRQSFFEAVKARSVFRGRMIVCAGVELGQPLQDLSAAEDALGACRFDIVLASVHNVKDEKDFYYIDFKEDSSRAIPLLDRYFQEIYDTVCWGKFDVLTHLTYPLRYIVGRDGVAVDMARYDDITDEIMKKLVQSGKALEINTSGLRGDLKETMPGVKYIKRFKELGGELITIGADAHRVTDVGANVEDAMQLALDVGFKYLTMYEKRKAIPVPIE